MSELDDLTSILLPKTIEGKIKWTLDGDERVYTVQGGNTIGIAWNVFDTITLSIRNKDGILVLSREFDAPEESYKKLIVIREKARRLALKVDEIFLDLKERLNSL